MEKIVEKIKALRNNHVLMTLLIGYFICIVGTIVDINNAKYLLLVTIIGQIITIVKNRHDNIIFIFSLFLLTYYTPLVSGYFKAVKLTPHAANFTDNFDELTLLIYSIFGMFYSIVMLLDIDNKTEKFIDAVDIKENNHLYVVSILGTIVCILLSHTGEITIGNYAGGGHQTTIFNEYFLIPLTLAFLFAGRSRAKIIGIFAIIFIYSVKNIIAGDRIGLLQVGLLTFIFILDNKVNYKVIIGLFILAIYGLNIIGDFRVTGNIDLNVINQLNIKFNTPEMINTNQTQVFNSSITIIRLIEENVLTIWDRGNSFIQYVLRLVLPSSFLSPLSTLSSYAAQYYPAQGGGFIAAYFYVWLGMVGVAMSGLFIGLVLKFKTYFKKSLVTALIIVMISFFPRWVAYDPLVMIKIPMYTGIALFIFNYYHNNLYSKVNILIETTMKKYLKKDRHSVEE